MKIIEEHLIDESTSHQKKKCIITGTIQNKDVETLNELDCDIIDASAAKDDTLQPSLKSVKNAVSFKFPQNVKELSKFALSFCPKLEHVYLSRSISKIGEKAFCYSGNLKSIDVDPENEWFASINGVLYSKDHKTLIRCPEGIFNSFEIPEGVEEIASFAFYGCNGLRHIHLPNSLKIIGESAFQQCECLRQISIPDSVKSISESTFFGCSELEEVLFPSQLEQLHKNAFYGCVKLTSIKLPNTLSLFENECFERCFSLTNISIENGGKFSSSGNAIVKDQKIIFLPIKNHKYTITKGLISIGASAFEQTEIEQIEIADSITTIENRAFRGCYNIASISLPASIKHIEDRAFDSCTNLTTIKVHASTPPIVSESAFNFLPFDECTLYVPTQSIEAYKADSAWNKFKTINAL